MFYRGFWLYNAIKPFCHGRRLRMSGPIMILEGHQNHGTYLPRRGTGDWLGTAALLHDSLYRELYCPHGVVGLYCEENESSLFSRLLTSPGRLCTATGMPRHTSSSPLTSDYLFISVFRIFWADGCHRQTRSSPSLAPPAWGNSCRPIGGKFFSRPHKLP